MNLTAPSQAARFPKKKKKKKTEKVDRLKPNVLNIQIFQGLPAKVGFLRQNNALFDLLFSAIRKGTKMRDYPQFQ